MDDSILVVPTTTKGVLPDLIVDLNAKELKRKHSNNSLLLESLESTIDNHHHHHHQHQSTSSPPNEHQSKKLTTEKRKAQNRAAQRNFRERKRNNKMRDLIECLEAENKFLRQHVNQTILDELAKIIPNSKNRVELNKPTQPNNHSNNNSNGTILSESEEHTRAATALSSLATGTPAIIDPVFDPQLAHLAGPSHQSNPSTIQAGTGDLIVPCSSASPSALLPLLTPNSSLSPPLHPPLSLLLLLIQIIIFITTTTIIINLHCLAITTIINSIIIIIKTFSMKNSLLIILITSEP
ncbi:hypothetical protein KEM48_006946 [Puccinia striiformis f. sp. tritici PST-130]|nr:hypothetical protein KEM48_006946 [Puccinia striiformis f. sp. tritici PST-130]